MRIFITGGTGIIGRALVPVLRQRGHEVLVLTRQQQSGDGHAQGNLEDADAVGQLLQRFAPDAAVHLAWESLPDYSLPQTLRNFEHSLRFIRLAAEAGCQAIVSTGSCWEYASRIGQLDEDAPLDGQEPFHAAKNALRFLGQAIARTHGSHLYWLRLFFVYGPGQRPQSLVPHLISSLRAGQPPALKAPHNRHDFVFVADVARAIAAVIEQRPAGTVYNVGSGQPTAVAEVIAAVEGLLGSSHATQVPAGVPDQDFWADITRLQRDTDWRPAFDLEAGLRQTLQLQAGAA
jgi:nucleoside-diphosphate-sugar epimerase